MRLLRHPEVLASLHHDLTLDQLVVRDDHKPAIAPGANIAIRLESQQQHLRATRIRALTQKRHRIAGTD
jgi:hypothetical protein